MGSVVGKVMEENFKKQQVFMEKNQEVMLGRNIQMQNQMRERMMAMQIARQRDMFHFFTGLYICVLAGAISGIVHRKPAAIVPAVPFTFVWCYLLDGAYYTKMKRMRDEADNIMENESDLLILPHDLPTLASIDAARLKK